MDESSYQYEKIYRDLAEDIRQGTYKPGDQLPTELALAKAWGVSRITSKKALNLLAQQGLVVRRRGLGTFVSKSGLSSLMSRNPGAALPPRGQGKRRIGLIMEDLGESYALDLFYQMERQADRLGFQICLGISYGDQAVERQAIRDLMALDIEGLLVMPSHSAYYDTDLLRLVLSHFPLVLIDRPLNGIPAPCVCSNNEEGARLLTEHLLSRGHQDIVYVTTNVAEAISLEERYQGYVKAMRQNGLEPRLPKVLPELARFSQGARDAGGGEGEPENALLAWLMAHEEVTAIICAEYGIAHLARDSARRLNRAVPGSLAICCFDEKYGYLGEYDFTHIQQDTAAMAQQALDILWAMLEGKNMRRQKRIIPVALMPGKST